MPHNPSNVDLPMLKEHAHPQPQDAPSFPVRLTSRLIHIVVTSAAIAAALAVVWRTQDPLSRARTTLGHRSQTRGCQFGTQPYIFEDAGGTVFNETPQEWRLLPFDAACQPQALVSPLLNASRSVVPQNDKLVVMLIGDRRGRRCCLQKTAAVHAGAPHTSLQASASDAVYR